MGTYKVWIIDNEGLQHDEEMALYEQYHVDYRISTDETLEKDLAEFGQYAEAVVVDVNFPCTAAFLDRLPHCKMIGTSSMGVDHIDVPAATERGMYVCNVPDYCREEVADHTLALSLTLLRRLFAYNKHVRQGAWDPIADKPVHRLSETVVGLLGFGHIARLVAQRFKGFGARVIAHDRFIPADVFAEHGVDAVPMEDLFKTSDLLSLHVPLTDETAGLVDRERMRQLPSGAVIVNTCRGGIIDETALADLLAEGHLSGAGIDVLEAEPPEDSHPLLQTDEAIITPHAAFYSVEAEKQLQTDTAMHVINVLQGRTPDNLVNRV